MKACSLEFKDYDSDYHGLGRGATGGVVNKVCLKESRLRSYLNGQVLIMNDEGDSTTCWFGNQYIRRPRWLHTNNGF